MPGHPPPPPAADAPSDDDFQTVARSFDPTEARLLASMLTAAGLPAVVADAHLAETHGLLVPALRGVSVRVRRRHLAPATEVLSAFRRGALELGDDFDPGPPA